MSLGRIQMAKFQGYLPAGEILGKLTDSDMEA